MLNNVPVPVVASLIGGSPEEVFQQAVVSVEPVGVAGAPGDPR
jgi:hypothetical protein